MVLELELPARGQDCRPAAGAPLLLPGGVCRIVNNPDKLKGKEYVNRQPYFQGAQKRVYDACTKRLTRTSSLEARGGARMYTQ